MSSQLMVATGKLKIENERRLKAKQEKKRAAAASGNEETPADVKKDQ